MRSPLCSKENSRLAVCHACVGDYERKEKEKGKRGVKQVEKQTLKCAVDNKENYDAMK